MKILFVNQYYWPDSAATAQMLQDLAEHLVRSGHEVHVVCSRGKYDDGSNQAGLTPAEEEHHGVHIHRVRATGFGKRGFLAQGIDFLSFYVMVLGRVVRSRRFDLIVTLTTPPLIGLMGTIARTLGPVRHVNWVMDLHPDVEFEMNVFRRGALVPGMLDRLNQLELRRSHGCVALGEYMKRRLINKHVAAERVEVIPVWGHDHVAEAHGTAADGPNPLREELKLGGKFVVMYSGNAGMIHTFDEVCAAALELRDDPRFAFLFVGGGRRLQEVRAFQESHGLKNVTVRGYFPRERLPDSLTLADVHLITLRPGLAGVSIPSKLYGVMAAARPAIFVGPEACETADAIRAADCGRIIRSGDGPALVAALRELAGDPELCRRLGRNARVPFDREFNAGACCERWRLFLEKVAG